MLLFHSSIQSAGLSFNEVDDIVVGNKMGVVSQQIVEIVQTILTFQYCVWYLLQFLWDKKHAEN